MKNSIFPKLLSDKIERKLLEAKKPTFAIGIDTRDEDSSAYCLVKLHGNDFEIINFKTIRNRSVFEEEVRNLVKYFNVEEFNILKQ